MRQRGKEVIHLLECSIEAVATMIGCLPTQALAFLAVFVYATHATQAIAFEWKPGFRTLGQHEFAFGFCGSIPEVLRRRDHPCLTPDMPTRVFVWRVKAQIY